MAPDQASWYVIIAEQETGPLTRVELGVELATGAITPDSLVWKEGMIKWLPGTRVPELEALFKNPPRSPRATGARPPPPPRKQDKGMGLSDFDTSHFRLADLQPEAGGATRQMEFDTSHFRLADLKGAQGARALVPRRIVPRGMEAPELPQSPNNPGKAGPRNALKQASTAAAKPMSAAPVAVRLTAPAKPLPAPAASDFDPNATAVDYRTLGELVHQQVVAQSLFETELGPEEAPLIEDLAARLKAKARAASPPPVPMPRERSWLPTAVAIAGVLALLVALVWYLLAD